MAFGHLAELQHPAGLGVSYPVVKIVTEKKKDGKLFYKSLIFGVKFNLKMEAYLGKGHP